MALKAFVATWKQSNSNKILLIILAVVMCCFFIFFCNVFILNDPMPAEPTQDMKLIYTQAYLIAESELFLSFTNTAKALPTATLTSTLISTLTPTLTSTLTPTLTPTLTHAITVAPETISITKNVIGADCIPENETEIAKVVEIIDGDTIRVYLNEKVYSVRYIGIDTPEKNGELYSLEATLKNSDLVFGKEVKLVRDVSETDRYGRLLRYIIADNIFVNLELVSSGYARATAYPPDTACKKAFQDTEQLAKNATLGIWQSPATALPFIPNLPTTGSNTACDPSYPGVCIPKYPPDLDCGEISYEDFQVLPPDPHGFDRDRDGIGCES